MASDGIGRWFDRVEGARIKVRCIRSPGNKCVYLIYADNKTGYDDETHATRNRSKLVEARGGDFRWSGAAGSWK